MVFIVGELDLDMRKLLFFLLRGHSQRWLQVLGGLEASTVCKGVSLRKVIQNYPSKLGAGPWQGPRLGGAEAQAPSLHGIPSPGAVKGPLSSWPNVRVRSTGDP